MTDPGWWQTKIAFFDAIIHFGRTEEHEECHADSHIENEADGEPDDGVDQFHEPQAVRSRDFREDQTDQHQAIQNNGERKHGCPQRLNHVRHTHDAHLITKEINNLSTKVLNQEREFHQSSRPPVTDTLMWQLIYSAKHNGLLLALERISKQLNDEVTISYAFLIQCLYSKALHS